jgi:hypothetical protein
MIFQNEINTNVFKEYIDWADRNLLEMNNKLLYGTNELIINRPKDILKSQGLHITPWLFHIRKICLIFTNNYLTGKIKANYDNYDNVNNEDINIDSILEDVYNSFMEIEDETTNLARVFVETFNHNLLVFLEESGNKYKHNSWAELWRGFKKEVILKSFKEFWNSSTEEIKDIFIYILNGLIEVEKLKIWKITILFLI